MRFSVLPISLSVAFALAATAARAEAPVYRLRIEAGPLSGAINALALQTGRQVLFSPEAVRGKWTHPLNGAYDLETALTRLLAGSGLEYSLAEGMIVVRPAPGRLAVFAEAPPSPPVDLEAVIITAAVAEAPGSVERLNLGALGATPTAGLQDAARMSSSLSTLPSGAGQLKLALRGVYGAGEATTPLYFAGLPISGPSGTTSDPGLITPDLALVDIERVDVLRGPQGVDHGAGAIGGELRITPRRPVLGIYEGEAAAALSTVSGGEPGYESSLVANLPLGERAAVRGVLYANRVGGYVDNLRLNLPDANQQTRQGGRLALRVEPGGGLDVDAFLAWQHQRLDDAASWNGALGAYLSDRSGLNWNENAIGVAGATVRLDRGGYALTSSTAYYQWNLTRQLDSTNLMSGLATDPDGCLRYFDLAAADACSAGQMAVFSAYVMSRSPGALDQKTSIHALVQELRAEGATVASRWTVGLFYTTRSEHARSAAVVLDPTGAVLPSAGYTGLRTLGSLYQQAAAYGQVVRRFGPRLTLTAGARYDSSLREAWSDVLVPNITSGSVQSVPKRARNGGRWSGRVRGDWRVGRGGLYALVATGSRPGGVNTTPDPAQAQRTFSPDSVIDYELGAHDSWLGGALSAEAAVFRVEMRNMQFAAITPNSAFGYVTNIGSARIEGAEAALRARRGPFSAEFNVAVTDARLTGEDPDRALVRGARAGDRVPNVPGYRHILAVSWRRPLPREASLTLSWQNERRASITNQFRPDDPWFIRSPGYWLNNVSATYERGPVSLAAQVRNLFDVVAVDRTMSSGYGLAQTYSAAPRTISVAIRRRW